MISFFAGLILPAAGYLVYGAFVDKVFQPDGRKTPAVDHPDGVDYIPSG